LPKKLKKHHVAGNCFTFSPNPTKGRQATNAENSKIPNITTFTIVYLADILYLKGCNIARYLSNAMAPTNNTVAIPEKMSMNDM
jgi:hypothetical protein